MFNPGSNTGRVSRLRLVNPGEEAAEVSIAGVDDRGRSSVGEVTTTIPAGASRTFTAADLESGSDGLEGMLGDGEGKWRLMVESAQPIVAMSLLSDTAGHLTNLSTAPGRGSQGIPDLVVVSSSVSNAEPVAGATFTLSATVRNDGGASAPVTVLRFVRSSDATITVTDRAVGTDAVAGLAASGSTSESVALNAPSAPGTYYYGACVDVVAKEFDTTNNCSKAIEVNVLESAPESPGQPDLVVASPSVNDSVPATGATFILSVTVRNAGDGTAPSAMMRYYRSSDSAITTSDTPAGTDEVVELGASGSSSKSVELTAPATPGTYYYGACVDTVAREFDTTNNCSAAVEVNVPASQPQSQGHPDLRIPAVSVAARPGGTYTDEAFTLAATVRNDGDGDAAATTLRYYRSADSTITASDTEIGTDAVTGLAALTSGSASVDLNAPSAPGTYYYGACVDAVAEESDTTNNCSTSRKIEVLDPQRPPDLVVVSPSVPGDGPVAGETFALSATARNDGDGDSASTTLRYFRSPDATITASDTEVGADAVAGLAASASSDESVRLTAPSTAGTYWYGACVDAVARESDTTNNCSASVKVDVEEPPKRYPDLEVSTPTVDDASPEGGSTFMLSVTVTNAGDAESAATTLRYYISADDTISTTDGQVETDAVGALPAQGSSAKSTSLPVPRVAGAYWFGVCVDAVAGESDTTDNCSSPVQVNVTGPPRPPDLKVGAPTASEGSLDQGATFMLSATVTNAGDTESAATTLRYYRSADTTITTSDTQVGTSAVGALSAQGTSAESISLTAPPTAGEYWYGACVDAVADESDTTDNCSASVRVHVKDPVGSPDLEVGTPTVDEPNPETGATFMLSVTVTNAGDAESAATTLGYYISADDTISTTDTQIGTDAVGALPAQGKSAKSLSLPAPWTVGKVWYGACVDALADESDTTDNCSASVLVDVKAGSPDLVVGAPAASDPSPRAGAAFTLSATVTNAGSAESAATTMLRYYHSSDDTISTTDTLVGTDAVEALWPARRSAESISLTAPSTAGGHWYGACVDAVTGESDTTNNCSSSVKVDVQAPPRTSPGLDIDLVYVDPQPSAAIKAAIDRAAAVWERAITNDLSDVDYAGNPRNNACTDGEFDGYVDDVRVYVYVVDIDGTGGTLASAGYCTGRALSQTPVIGRIRFDSSDVGRLGTATVEHVALHELAHVLGFGTRWSGLRNPSRGLAISPPPDTHFPGTNAVAAFNAAGGSSYTGGKVPVENERGGSGSQDKHWRLSVMPGELMTYNLDGFALSAITIRSMADLGYAVNTGVADSYTVPSASSAKRALAAARVSPLRCEIEDLEVEYVPEAGRRSSP